MSNVRLESLPQLGRTPLPEVVADTLRVRVLSGLLQPGEQLPAEPDLARQLGVSRASLRHAISLLTFEGLLARQRGRGTFVTLAPPDMLHSGLTTLISTTALIRAQGYEPGTRGWQLALSDVPEALVKRAGFAPDQRVWHVSRTRLANGRPVVYCEDFVPVELLSDSTLIPEAPSSDWSLYEALARVGMAPAWARCTIVPTTADATVAERLCISPGFPLLLLRQLHYMSSGAVVLYSENWHNSSLLEFEIMRRA